MNEFKRIAYNVYGNTVDNQLIAQAYKEAEEILVDAGVIRTGLGLLLMNERGGLILRIDDSSRMKTSLGTTRAIRDRGRIKGFLIRFQRGLVDEKYYNDLLQVMVHELIHVIYPHDGHTGMFKWAAKRVNDYRPEMNVQTYYKEEEHAYKAKEVNRREKKYAVQCPVCGHIWEYATMAKAVRFPNLYKCKKCGVALERIR